MTKLIDILRTYDIPTHSYIAAVQSLTYIDITPDQYRSRIEELMGNTANIEDIHLRIHYKYLVQEIVRGHMNDNDADVFDIATELATTYCNNHEWSFVECASKIDPISNKPVAKKGAKKRKAQELWKERKAEDLTRKEWIAILVAEVPLTPAGASTYYSNLKSNRM